MRHYEIGGRNNNMNNKTDEELYEFCKAHYYCDSGELWQPFEFWDKEEVEELIQNDVYALKQFLGITE
jgi:hypothetical protein